jgi:hypothetical protein
MVLRTWLPTLTKHEISRLRGGEKHDFYYFVGVSETAESNILTSIMRVKLLNQMATQKWGRFPEGYEPFRGSFGVERLCLRTMTIRVPRLRLRLTGWPNPKLVPKIERVSMSACVLDPGARTEELHVLKAEAEVFEIKHRIRCHAAESHARLELVLSFLAYGGAIRLLPDPADLFEAYLCLRPLDFLRDLLVLLDMPESPGKSTMPNLPQAA